MASRAEASTPSAVCVIDGKTFTRVGSSDDDMDSIDASLKALSLPKLSTHLAVSQSVDAPLFLVYKNTNRNVVLLSMSESQSVHLSWLCDVHVSRKDDGDRAVTYTTAPVSAAERMVGFRIEERDRTPTRVTFTLAAFDDRDLVAINMPTRTPSGLDSGMSAWRAGVTFDGEPYWIHYMYLYREHKHMIGFSVVEDMNGDIFVIESPIDASIRSSFAALSINGPRK